MSRPPRMGQRKLAGGFERSEPEWSGDSLAKNNPPTHEAKSLPKAARRAAPEGAGNHPPAPAPTNPCAPERAREVTSWMLIRFTRQFCAARLVMLPCSASGQSVRQERVQAKAELHFQPDVAARRAFRKK
jgi:hypothetical protein